MSVIIETSLGDITIDLYTDERPKCKYTGGIIMGVSFFLFYHYGTGSFRPESRSPPESFRPESRSPPQSFRPYSRSPRVVSPRFINSALKNEIWKIPF
jgi:hypothetical protein